MFIFGIVDPCVAEEPDVQESDKIGTYKERQGTAVGYTCHPGLKFDAGGVSRSAICLDGQWLYIAPSCQGCSLTVYVWLWLSLSLCLSLCPSICLFVCLSICLCFCLSVSLCLVSFIFSLSFCLDICIPFGMQTSMYVSA